MNYLESDKYYLAPFKAADITNKYIGWLNNPSINQFLECRFVNQTPQSVGDYVNSFSGCDDKFIWGIYVKDNNAHIGTVTLHSISLLHRSAEIGLMIGDSEFWGLGAAEESFIIVISFAFNVINLRKVTTGTYSVNTGINFTLKKLNFSREGVLREAFFFNGQFIDGWRWGLLESEWDN